MSCDKSMNFKNQIGKRGSRVAKRSGAVGCTRVLGAWLIGKGDHIEQDRKEMAHTAG
jgi:hypothetical protein